MSVRLQKKNHLHPALKKTNNIYNWNSTQLYKTWSLFKKGFPWILVVHFQPSGFFHFLSLSFRLLTFSWLGGLRINMNHFLLVGQGLEKNIRNNLVVVPVYNRKGILNPLWFSPVLYKPPFFLSIFFQKYLKIFQRNRKECLAFLIRFLLRLLHQAHKHIYKKRNKILSLLYTWLSGLCDVDIVRSHVRTNRRKWWVPIKLSAAKRRTVRTTQFRPEKLQNFFLSHPSPPPQQHSGCAFYLTKITHNTWPSKYGAHSLFSYGFKKKNNLVSCFLSFLYSCCVDQQQRN